MDGTRAGDEEYMTVWEFAALPSDVRHAVWAAAARKAVGTVPAAPYPGGCRRYRRDQVQAIVRDLEARRA